MVLDLIKLIGECAPNVGTITMLAIVHTESGGNPLAIGNNTTHERLAPQDLASAISTAKRALGKGQNLDLGLGQINSSNLLRLGIPVEDIFEPCTNLRAAATILSWGYKQAVAREGEGQNALLKAVSSYNTGSLSKGFQNGYVQKVVSKANNSDKLPLKIPNIATGSVALTATSPSQGAAKIPLSTAPLIDEKETIDPRSAPLEALTPQLVEKRSKKKAVATPIPTQEPETTEPVPVRRVPAKQKKTLTAATAPLVYGENSNEDGEF